MSDEGEGRPAPVKPGEEPRAFHLLDRPERFPLARAGDRWEAVEVREPTLPMYVRPSLPSNVEPEAWFYLLDFHEYDIPPLFEDLRERVPQALLRDLHRPVQEFFITPEVVEGTIAPGRTLHEALDEVRAARVLEKRPPVEPILAAVIEEQRRHRALMAEPWEPLLPDDAPRREVNLGQEEED